MVEIGCSTVHNALRWTKTVRTKNCSNKKLGKREVKKLFTEHWPTQEGHLLFTFPNKISYFIIKCFLYKKRDDLKVLGLVSQIVL